MSEKPRFCIDLPWGMAWWWYFEGAREIAALCGYQWPSPSGSYRMAAIYFGAFFLMALGIYWADLREWRRKQRSA